jgi:endonuclease YncB( thermonuclease family)
MIDETTTPEPVSRDGADPRRSWAHMRERMREAIRAEIDRINPTDDARRALELIVESSVRPSEADGELKLTIIDQSGQPRTIEKDGHPTDFTLHDLLEELRVRYPVLFRPAKTETASVEAPEGRPPKREKPQRDWLNLDSGEHPAEVQPSEPLIERAPVQARRGKLRIHEWSRNALTSWRRSEAPTSAASAEAVRDPIPATVGKERPVMGGMQARSLARPGLAIGAVAILALVGVGAFMFRGSHPDSHQAAVSAPAATGAAAATQVPDPGPAETGSTKAGPLRGVPDVIDTATLSLQGEVVRLFGVEWAPGGGKPEDLTSYLQGREVVCEPAGKNETYRCQVGGQDLSRVVLFNGGGQPTADATPELKAAADKAREAKLGVWGKSP